MNYDIFEETKKQIIKVQLWITEYNLKQQRLREEIPDFIPNSMYFKLRNCYEALRIDKLRLNQRKNYLEARITNN